MDQNLLVLVRTVTRRELSRHPWLEQLLDQQPIRRDGLSQAPYKRHLLLVSPSDAEYSKSDEPYKVLIHRRCPGLQLSSSSFAHGPGNI